MSTQTCTTHCRACGRCFHGDHAFDQHRQFRDREAAQAKDWSRRICADPASDSKMELWTGNGECRISGGNLRGVQIWRMKPTESQLRSIARFQEARLAGQQTRGDQLSA